MPVPVGPPPEATTRRPNTGTTSRPVAGSGDPNRPVVVQ